MSERGGKNELSVVAPGLSRSPGEPGPVGLSIPVEMPGEATETVPATEQELPQPQAETGEAGGCSGAVLGVIVAWWEGRGSRSCPGRVGRGSPGGPGGGGGCVIPAFVFSPPPRGFWSPFHGLSVASCFGQNKPGRFCGFLPKTRGLSGRERAWSRGSGDLSCPKITG